MLKHKYFRLGLALASSLLFILIVQLLYHTPKFATTYYSNEIYIYLSKILRYIFGWLPFSFGDVCYITALGYIIRKGYFILRHLKKPKKHVLHVVCFLGICSMCFYMFWGVNYCREPLHKTLKVNEKYTTEQLVDITEKLLKKANDIHVQITGHDTIKVDFIYSKNQLINMAAKGYNDSLKRVIPNLDYNPKSIKMSLLSFPLTYMGFSGYLNPFTNEAQVNALIPEHKVPVTASHEIAHQLGYAAENEANFIGFMAAISHDNMYFKYSGYIFGLRYCLNEIYKRDVCLFEDLRADINKGVMKHYADSSAFWNLYKNPIEPFFKWFYNGYLKTHKQHKGITSYSYVVALICNTKHLWGF